MIFMQKYQILETKLAGLASGIWDLLKELLGSQDPEPIFEPVPVPVRYATRVRATNYTTTSVGGISKWSLQFPG